MSDVVTRSHQDGRLLTVERVQDVEPIIERNKSRQNERQDIAAGWHHIAEIPNIFLEQWLNEEYARGNTTLRMHTTEFDAVVQRKLRHPDWKFLRATDRRF